MITRRVANQQLADKLQLTLLELKTAKEFSSQLLSERADSEKELVAVLDSNNRLKKELCLLEKQFNDANSERARLQESVDRFSECSGTYEQALKDINSLERALHDAHEQIYELQEAKDNATAAHTQSLFEELVGPVSQLLTAPIENPVVSADNAGLNNDSTTSRCTQQVQRTCGNVFNGHIIVNIAVLVQLMSQMQNSDRSLSSVLPIVASAAAMLFSTGVIMWSAGDITVEASNLPTAIFLSGWHHCTNTSAYRIRRLLLVAIAQSQIVKASYSLFSVLY